MQDFQVKIFKIAGATQTKGGNSAGSPSRPMREVK